MTDIAGERARLAAQGLQIIRRETWGAQQSYTSDRAVQWPASYLFLHITVTGAPSPTLSSEFEACRQVESIGQTRFGIGWSYNAGCMQSGRLYEGQPLTRRGAHTVNDRPNPWFPTGSLNEEARALAIVQNIQDVVTDAQIDSAARWGAALRRSGEAVRDAKWFGHRDVTAKSCPGDRAYARLPELNALTDHYTNLEDTLSAAEVAQIIAAIDDTRPFFAQDPGYHPAVWIVYKDAGKKRWVQTETMWRAAQADRVFSNGFDANGLAKPWFRSKAHLDTLETVGPSPEGWD